MKIDSINMIFLLKLGLWDTVKLQSEVRIIDIHFDERQYRNIYVSWEDSDQNIRGHWIWW